MGYYFRKIKVSIKLKLTLGFKSMKTAYATPKGFEIIRMFKKGQLLPWMPEKNISGEACLINQTFGVYIS